MSPMDYYFQLNNLMGLLDDNEKNTLLQLFSQLEGAGVDVTQDAEGDEHLFEEIDEVEEQEQEEGQEQEQQEQEQEQGEEKEKEKEKEKNGVNEEAGERDSEM